MCRVFVCIIGKWFLLFLFDLNLTDDAMDAGEAFNELLLLMFVCLFNE